MNNPLHRPFPYPQTPASAQALFAAEGICMTHWAADLGLPRMTVVDALRGRSKGRRGLSHLAYVALGLKPAPRALRAAK